MKRYLIFVLALIYLPCFGQTVINRDGAIKAEPYVTPYDSLSNFRKLKHDDREDYYHLIGQRAMYLGDPYSSTNNPNLVVGDEYIIQDVMPDEIWGDALCCLKVKSTKTNKIIRVNPGLLDRMNSSWIILGYVEKLYSYYAGVDYLYYSRQYSHDKADHLICCETNTINTNIPNGTIWTLIEVQVLPRLKNDGMDLDNRSGIVFVLENSDYGKYYVYYEDSNGDASYGPFISMFRRIIANPDIDLSQIKIGMTEEECKAILGSPIRISNRTTYRNGRVERSIVLGFYKNISIVFVDGVVVDIETGD